MAEGSRTPECLADSKVRVKKEDDSDSTDKHSHKFKVTFNSSGRHHPKYPIYCQQHRTLLEAIRSSEKYDDDLKCADENIIIQLGMADKERVVPTHFPCSCVEDGELLIISRKSEKIEEATNKPDTVHPRNKYSVFYIDKKGGKNATEKVLFRSKAIKQFKYLCVYGEKGMTVEEALKRDGRFKVDFSSVTLSDSENPANVTECKQKVDSLDGKTFKLCLPRKKRKNKKTQPCASNNSQRQNDSVPDLAVAQQRGTSVKTVEKSGSSVKGDSHESKKKLEDHFSVDFYQEALNLRMEDFGKIQKSFSEVHRVKDLLKLGESVCKVLIGDVCVGTGFVLFDNYILTNAHLFRGCVEEEKKNLQEGKNVFALFNYDRPETDTDYHRFTVEKTFIDFSDGELDYAVLELSSEGQTDEQTETLEIPPGLLKTFGPVPEDGAACIIGHPKGEVKQMDPTCIIEKENRGKAFDDQLEPNRNSPITLLCSISQEIRNQGIENIPTGGSQADKVEADNTSMYHGSPVFDTQCRVFGLHTGGCVHEFSNHTKSVIEFAQPLLTIFESLVTEIKESEYEELLESVKEEVRGNRFLENVLKSVERNERED